MILSLFTHTFLFMEYTHWQCVCVDSDNGQNWDENFTHKCIVMRCGGKSYNKPLGSRVGHDFLFIIFQLLYIYPCEKFALI